MLNDHLDHQDQIIEEEITEIGITGNKPVFPLFLCLLKKTVTFLWILTYNSFNTSK
jgi:hypothetical protein